MFPSGGGKGTGKTFFQFAAAGTETLVFSIHPHDDHITPLGDDAAVGTAELCPGALVRAEMAVFRRITHIAGAFSAMGADLDFCLQNKCDSQK